MQKVEGSNPFSRLLLPAVEPKTKGWFVSLQNLALQLESVVLPSKPEEQDQEQPIKQAQAAELAEWTGVIAALRGIPSCVATRESSKLARLDAAPGRFLDLFEELRMDLSNEQVIAEAVLVNYAHVGKEGTRNEYRGFLLATEEPVAWDAIARADVHLKRLGYIGWTYKPVPNVDPPEPPLQFIDNYFLQRVQDIHVTD